MTFLCPLNSHFGCHFCGPNAAYFPADKNRRCSLAERLFQHGWRETYSPGHPTQYIYTDVVLNVSIGKFEEGDFLPVAKLLYFVEDGHYDVILKKRNKTEKTFHLRRKTL